MYLSWQGLVLLNTKHVRAVTQVSQATPKYKLCNYKLIWWELSPGNLVVRKNLYVIERKCI